MEDASFDLFKTVSEKKLNAYCWGKKKKALFKIVSLYIYAQCDPDFFFYIIIIYLELLDAFVTNNDNYSLGHALLKLIVQIPLLLTTKKQVI